MKTIKDHILQELLPTTSDYDRGLYYRTNEQLQKVVDIMKGYCEEVIDECANEIDEDDYGLDIRPDITADNVRRQITNIRYQL